MIYTITKSYTFCAAHRLEGHAKCGRLHGHNYAVTVKIERRLLEDGMVLDYNELDKIMKPLINRVDHRYIVSLENIDCQDPYGIVAVERGEAFILPQPRSTAEYIAQHFAALLSNVADVEGDIEVTVSETPKTTATFERKNA